MTKTARKVMVGMAIAMGIAGVPSVSAADRGLATEAPVVTRVRTDSPALATLIQEATKRSATFRSLVEAISATDGFVYVSEGTCGRGIRACLATVTTAGPSRFLRVKVDTRKADSDLMGSIGHELRHAVEVLGNPTVTSNAAMHLFYARIGRRATAFSFETDEAVRAGDAVRREAGRAIPKAGRW